MALLIAGGTGFIGRSLTQFYKSKGCKVFVVTRNPQRKNDMSWIDLERNGLPENVKTVINLSGRGIAEFSPLLLIDRYYKSFKQDLIDSRIMTTKSIVNLIKKSSTIPELFINSSAIGYYQPSATERYTEKSLFVDKDFITRLTKDWEDAANTLDIPGVRNIQLRTGLVLGSGGGILQKMYFPFICGVGGSIGTGNQWMSWIHMDDMIGLIDFIVNNSAVQTGPINATSPNPVTNKEFTSVLARALHRPSLLNTPEFAIKLVYGERSTLLLDGQRVFPQKALDLGYRFKFSNLDEAIKDIYK